MSNIKCLKLISGDEVIADIDEGIEGLVILKKPLQIMMIPNQNNQFGIGLAPFCPYAKDDMIPLRSGAILSIFEPETGMLNEYNSRYGSGLVVPESKIIV
ncbi:hypothetical protein EBV26_08725 [bacterium]|nr:hypothetical protein [bacterium]